MELFATALFVLIYLLPTIIAVHRSHNAASIFVLNLLLGWTLVFWVIALAWSLKDKEGETEHAAESDDGDTAEEIKKLYQLKEEGILTEEEFENKKKALLQQ